MIQLKPCPFCGGNKLKIDKKSRLAGYNGLDHRVNQVTYSVRCNTCHARGGAVGGKVIEQYHYYKTNGIVLPDWATTPDELKTKAIEAWNRRNFDVNTPCGAWQDYYSKLKESK